METEINKHTEKQVPTRALQDRVMNEPLHKQKTDSPEIADGKDKKRKIFDDTQASPSLYEKRLEVPAFLRKQQEG